MIVDILTVLVFITALCLISLVIDNIQLIFSIVAGYISSLLYPNQHLS